MISPMKAFGLLDESTATIGYDDGGLRLQVFEQNWIIWSTPNSETYENIHTEVTVHNNDDEPRQRSGSSVTNRRQIPPTIMQ